MYTHSTRLQGLGGWLDWLDSTIANQTKCEWIPSFIDLERCRPVIPDDIVSVVLPAPAAPQTPNQMTIPGAWDPGAMFATTYDLARAGRAGVVAGSGIGVPAGSNPAALETTDKTLFYVLIAAVGAALLFGGGAATGYRYRR